MFIALGLIRAITGTHLSLTWPLEQIEGAPCCAVDDVAFREPAMLFGLLVVVAGIATIRAREERLRPRCPNVARRIADLCHAHREEPTRGEPMSDDQTTQQTGNRVGLLVACLVLLAVDVVFLGLAIAFGPGGFGGDRAMSGEEVVAAHLGQGAGVAGCLLGGAAVVWMVAVDPHLRRTRAVTWIVGAQLIATTVLVVSTL